MNKTITINLGGIVFHIEEVAYEKLRKYLDSLRQHFSYSESKHEIIADIESRIAEMFQQKTKNIREAVILLDVDEAISAMGNPEEFGSEREGNEKEKAFTSNGFKRFFRNQDDRVLGGVCSGIAAYLGIDSLWFRLAFALSFFFWGSGFLLYIILWIIIPKAKTTAEKLEMRGERVDVSNIEKTIKEEFESLKNKYQNINKDKARNFFEKVIDFFLTLVKFFFKAVGKIVGAILIVIGVIIMVFLLMVLLGSFGLASLLLPIMTLIFASRLLTFMAFAGIVFLVAVPVIALLSYGIRMIFNLRKPVRIFGVSMGILWITGWILIFITGGVIAKEFYAQASVKENILIQQPSIDTLYIGTINNDTGEQEESSIFDTGTLNTIFTNNVKLNIVKSPSGIYELEKILSARGGNKKEARDIAEKINYSMQQKDSIILFSSQVLFQNTKWRGQKIKFVLKIPVGKTIYLQSDAENIIYDIRNSSGTLDTDMLGHYWKMKEEGLTCIDCL